MLDTKLIERALQLTGKTIDSMVHDNALAVFQEYSSKEWNPMDYFSIAEFCYYLLSQTFIEKYCEVNEDISYWTDREELAIELF